MQRIRTLGKRATVAINPATPAAMLEEIVQDLDQVLVMTVNPGFGHQQFIRTTLPKIERVRELVERRKPGCEVEVDGGIDATTAPLVVRAGATVLVAGSSIFNDPDGVATAMKRLRAAIDHTEDETDLAEQAALQGVGDATRNDRTRPHGRQHGVPASRGQPPVRGLRQVAESGRGVDSRQGHRGLVDRGSREEAGNAAGRVADGASGRCGFDHQ